MASARKEAQPGICFARKTLKPIGQAHGEPHLALTLRLIIESEGNAAELHGDTITAVSAALLSGIEAGSAPFEAFDRLDRRTLRAWAKIACPELSVADAMSAVMLWQLGPDKFAELKAVVEWQKEAAAKVLASGGRPRSCPSANRRRPWRRDRPPSSHCLRERSRPSTSWTRASRSSALASMGLAADAALLDLDEVRYAINNRAVEMLEPVREMADKVSGAPATGEKACDRALDAFDGAVADYRRMFSGAVSSARE